MNTPEKLFHTLLGLGDEWQITELEFDKDSSEVRLRITERPELLLRQHCPDDQGEVGIYDHGREREWRHLNVFEHKCFIQARLPRVRCKTCGKIFQVQAPWEGLSMHFTASFEAMVLLLMREMPVRKVSEFVQVSDTRLWRILARHVATAYRQLDFSDSTCIGVDELASRKGHRYVTVFADLMAKRVLFAVPGKDSATWKAFVEEIERHAGDASRIDCISMDMSVPFQKGALKNCPQAKLVFDKYHLIAKANKAVGDIRRAEIRLGGRYHDLKKTRWIWLKNPENLTEKQAARLERIDLANLVTAKAYQMRLSLQDIYVLESVGRAESRLLAWCRWVRQKAKQARYELLAGMVKVARCIEDHLQGILKHWESRVTNAYMEGLNNLFQMVKRRARGYRNEQNFIMMIYFASSKLNLPATASAIHSK